MRDIRGGESRGREKDGKGRGREEGDLRIRRKKKEEGIEEPDDTTNNAPTGSAYSPRLSLPSAISSRVFLSVSLSPRSRPSFLSFLFLFIIQWGPGEVLVN